MLGWLKLVMLRTKAIAVVERDFGRPLQIAGGRDTELFNIATRLAHQAGGNEYDAATAFVLAEAMTATTPADRSLVGKVTRLLPQMRFPASAEEQLLQAIRPR